MHSSDLWASPSPKTGIVPPPDLDDALGAAPGGNRILVLEDDVIVAFALENILSEAGYEIVAVSARGEDAAALADRHRPDLVLADVRLAGAMDGITAVATITARHAVPAIFLTAHTDAQTRERMAALAPADILAKPVPDPVLLAAVAAALRR